MLNEFYSVRMRAAEGGAHEQGGRHISGGERLGQKGDLHELAAELLAKSLNHSRGDCDFIQVVIEKLHGQEMKTISPLPVSTEHVRNVAEGREKAAFLLSTLGISDEAIKRGLNLLKRSTRQRGAMIIDSQTGQRLDERELKGVRVSRMDWEAKGWEKWSASYRTLSSSRIREALALASKVASSPYTLAELCWSDDPDYVTGYVASPSIGYRRITHLKEIGDSCGGRIFFAERGCNISAYIAYLEKTPVWLQYEPTNLISEGGQGYEGLGRSGVTANP
ncbi:6-carboxyhexanoate--CoA ligase [Bacillus songklensis]|uniref:6-carboxyhexanoate--CoA ligase n=1 Tax=Bacillus songklensis TaxID=1069116 RepID=A0ABV8B4S3_9BACI